MNPSDHEMAMVKRHRPELVDTEGLDRELELEYHNAMLYASNKVLSRIDAFLKDRSLANWRGVTRAMKKDLYL